MTFATKYPDPERAELMINGVEETVIVMSVVMATVMLDHHSLSQQYLNSVL